MNFLAVKNIADMLEAGGFRRLDPCQPLGTVKAGDRFFVTKNDSSIYAFRIGSQPLAEAGFHMICAHSDSPRCYARADSSSSIPRCMAVR